MRGGGEGGEEGFVDFAGTEVGEGGEGELGGEVGRIEGKSKEKVVKEVGEKGWERLGGILFASNEPL